MTSRSHRWMVLATVLSLVPVSPLRGQVSLEGEDHFGNAPHWLVGYTINAPTQLVGIGTAYFSPGLGGWGVYADAKLTLESPTNESSFDPSLTSAEAEERFDDDLFDERDIWTTVNVAAVRTLLESLAVYAGAGFSDKKAYHEYFDNANVNPRGELGYYWVEDVAASGTFVNLLAGGFFRASESVVFQFGVESQPRGFTVGGSIAVPFIR